MRISCIRCVQQPEIPCPMGLFVFSGLDSDVLSLCGIQCRKRREKLRAEFYRFIYTDSDNRRDSDVLEHLQQEIPYAQIHENMNGGRLLHLPRLRSIVCEPQW